MNNFTAYIRMALGFQLEYTVDQAAAEIEAERFAHIEYVWENNTLADEICEAWGISRERFVRSMAAPKPSGVMHLIFNSELAKRGLQPLSEWPKAPGLIIPERQGERITGIKFMRLSEALNRKSRSVNAG